MTRVGNYCHRHMLVHEHERCPECHPAPEPVVTTTTTTAPYMTYAAMVAQISKDGWTILPWLNGGAIDLWHAATGISTEAGEILDAIKKHVIYNKELDRVNVLEELGDIEFYMELMRQKLGVDRADVLLTNMVKLHQRYPGFKYTDEAAQARADKA